jgi:hypothetical protein
MRSEKCSVWGTGHWHGPRWPLHLSKLSRSQNCQGRRQVSGLREESSRHATTPQIEKISSSSFQCPSNPVTPPAPVCLLTMLKGELSFHLTFTSQPHLETGLRVCTKVSSRDQSKYHQGINQSIIRASIKVSSGHQSKYHQGINQSIIKASIRSQLSPL